jgi:hypothetical protein
MAAVIDSTMRCVAVLAASSPGRWPPPDPAVVDALVRTTRRAGRLRAMGGRRVGVLGMPAADD